MWLVLLEIKGIRTSAETKIEYYIPKRCEECEAKGPHRHYRCKSTETTTNRFMGVTCFYVNQNRRELTLWGNLYWLQIKAWKFWTFNYACGYISVQAETYQSVEHISWSESKYLLDQHTKDGNLKINDTLRRLFARTPKKYTETCSDKDIRCGCNDIYNHRKILDLISVFC
jgi:hypothetical protein